ncbi:cell division protein FtsW (lipid II flippase) [Murinocardiopsis flavida]|uniref:Cell division protein FtsW (Lipid II flippase) n=1 Tax=Murinocardiopsis flavida TaxID=645275 RepID=A0A2P8DFF9_9ACTN|nr:FtsW/RodA/SpoVE family cell cycle protein [Murinocardiopsis flavida]PSK95927.1 cell division protein FtsW (lipid II flippase) [Murinocardiopsis flavida]
MRSTPPSAPSPTRRRAVELVLLAAAVGAVAVAMVQAGSGGGPSLGPSLGYSAVLGAVGVLGHLAIRRTAPCADPLLLPCAVLLSGAAVAVAYPLHASQPGPSVDAAHAAAESAVRTQLLWAAAGLLVFAAVVYALRDPRLLRRHARTAAIGAVVLLLLPLVPGLGFTVNGGQWIAIPGVPTQPVEFAKILLVIAFAGYLAAEHGGRTPATGGAAGSGTGPTRLVAAAVVVGVLCIGVMGPLMHDFGTSTLVFGAFLAVAYTAIRRVRWPVIGAAAYIAACAVVIPLSAAFGPGPACGAGTAAPCTEGAEAGSATFASASDAGGGIVGGGLGAGRAAIPADAVLAGVGEELGLIGLLAVLATLVLLAQRAIRAATAAEEPFVRALAAGLACLIGLSPVLAALGAVHLIPATGATVPFLAMGSAAALSGGIVLALLVRITHDSTASGPGARP